MIARKGRGADLPSEISTSVKQDINRVVATDVHMLSVTGVSDSITDCCFYHQKDVGYFLLYFYLLWLQDFPVRSDVCTDVMFK